MVDGALKAYVENALQQGYSIEAIRSALYAQGYKQEDIEQMLGEITHPHHTPMEIVSGHPALVIVLIFIVVTLLAIGSASLIFFDDSGSVTTPAQVSRPQTAAPTQIPTTPQRQSVEEPAPVRDSQSTSDTRSTAEEQRNEPSSQQETQPSNQQFSLPVGLEVERQVRELAANYPDEAADLCTQLESQSGKDACYGRVAQASQDPTYCVDIQSSSVRDNCFIGFAIDNIGDEAICDQIEQSSLSSSCKKLYAAAAANPLTEQDLLNSYTDTTYS